MNAAPAAPVLEIRGLTTRFATPDGPVLAADRVELSIGPGESLGVVGESGSGKTQIFLSVMGLLARNGRSEGSIRWRGQEILGLPPRRLDRIRGAGMAMIFQDPMTSLNPYLTVGRQLGEVLEVHKGASAAQARARSLAMLERVGIPEAARRLDQYPHELSGGMRQRVMIAMALLCEPELLIADEPTTALDVTIQAQILDLLAELRRELGMAIALVTHDLGVIAGLTDRVLVLYAGRVVEEAPVEALFAAPRHPYTRGLLRSMPRLSGPLPEALEAIQGQPPDLVRLPKGCAFAPRCPQVHARCRVEPPELRPAGPGRRVACHLEAPA
jgi:oligopeptide transport system ATP-binding protein